MWNWDRRQIFKTSIIVVFWIGFLVLFLPFFSELLLAAVFALAIEPFLGRWLQQRHFRWRASVALILIGMFVILAVPVTALAYKAYAYVSEISHNGFQNSSLFHQIAMVRTELVQRANELLGKMGLSDKIDLAGISEDGVGRLANAGLQMFSNAATHIPRILVSIFVFCAALYFFLAESGSLKKVLDRQQVLSEPEARRLITLLQKSSYSIVISAVIIAVLQATIVGLGALILHTGDFMVIWVITFFCSFIPVIGAGPVAFSIGLFKLIEGDVSIAVGFFIVMAIASMVDNLVRPYLISSGEGDLHPIVTLLTIVGGLIVFGMPGLFLGPVIASVAVKIIPLLHFVEAKPKD